MPNPVNPYITGNPVGGGPAFVGRADVLREVLRILRRPQDNAIVLYGQRRIGKTSILQHLAAQLPAEGAYRPVYFDLQDKAAWPLGRVLGDLARAVAHAPGQPDPALGDDPATTFRAAWLPAVLDGLPAGCSLVLLFDEFDVLADPEAKQATEAFFPYLRELLAIDPERLQFAFVIGRNVDDLATIALSLFKGVPYRRVSLLSREDTAALVRLSQDNGSLRWPDESVMQVWQLTCGHPYLTQLLCSHVWERAYDAGPDTPPTVTAGDVDAAVPDALEDGRHALGWLWNGLPPAERVVASALAEAGPGPIAQEALERRLHDSGVRVLIRELQDAPQLLQEWDILEPAAGGYRFRVELLRRWLAEHKPLRRVQEELDRIEPVAESFYQAALGLYRGERLDEAIDPLRRAIGLNPNHARANQLLAEILLAQGKSDEAVQLLEQLYEYQPDAARPRLVQALLARAQAIENDEEKLAFYKRGLEPEPERQEVAVQVAEIEQNMHRRELTGLKRMERQVELADLYQRALESLQNGDRQTAQALLIRVINQEPTYKEATRYLHLAVTGVDVADLQAHLETEILNTRLSRLEQIVGYLKIEQANEALKVMRLMQHQLQGLEAAQRQQIEELLSSAVWLRRSRHIYARPDPDLQRRMIEFRTQMDLMQRVVLEQYTGVALPAENRRYGEIYLRRGIIAYYDNDVLKAREMLSIAAQFFPLPVSAQGIESISSDEKLPIAFTQFYLALIEKNYGNMIKAREHIENSYAACGKNEPEELLTPVARAEILSYLGDMDMAREAIQEVLIRADKLQRIGTLKRHDAAYALRAQLLLGNTYYVQGKWQQALEYFHKALEADVRRDNTYYAYNSIAQVYRQLSKDEATPESERLAYEEEARKNQRRAYEELIMTGHLLTKVALDTRILLNALAYLCTRDDEPDKAREYREAIQELWLRIHKFNGLELRLFSIEKKRQVSKEEFWTEVFGP